MVTEIELTLPKYFERVEEDNEILFLAFLYKLGVTYGNKNVFRLYNSDVRTILGLTGYYPHIWIQEKSWTKWVDTVDMADDAYGYRIRLVRGMGKDANTTIKKITDPRCILIWFYLLGCFNNNLVEDNKHKTKRGLRKEYKTILTGGLCETTFE
jgi:hypothetical protein